MFRLKVLWAKEGIYHPDRIVCSKTQSRNTALPREDPTPNSCENRSILLWSDIHSCADSDQDSKVEGTKQVVMFSFLRETRAIGKTR